MTITAWAITENGSILTTYVRATRRAAIIAYVEDDMPKVGQRVSANLTDEDVEELWEAQRGVYPVLKLDLVEVLVGRPSDPVPSP